MNLIPDPPASLPTAKPQPEVLERPGFALVLMSKISHKLFVVKTGYDADELAVWYRLSRYTADLGSYCPVTDLDRRNSDQGGIWAAPAGVGPGMQLAPSE